MFKTYKKKEKRKKKKKRVLIEKKKKKKKRTLLCYLKLIKIIGWRVKYNFKFKHIVALVLIIIGK